MFKGPPGRKLAIIQLGNPNSNNCIIVCVKLCIMLEHHQPLNTQSTSQSIRKQWGKYNSLCSLGHKHTLPIPKHPYHKLLPHLPNLALLLLPLSLILECQTDIKLHRHSAGHLCNAVFLVDDVQHVLYVHSGVDGCMEGCVSDGCC